MIFKIAGWGKVEFGHESSCGGAKGVTFREAGKAAGVMHYSEVARLIKFLQKRIKERGVAGGRRC